MINAIKWLRSKADKIESTTMVVTNKEAIASEMYAETYKVETFRYIGCIPKRFAKAFPEYNISKTNNETETVCVASGGFLLPSQCVYHRTIYSRA